MQWWQNGRVLGWWDVTRDAAAGHGEGVDIAGGGTDQEQSKARRAMAMVRSHCLSINNGSFGWILHLFCFDVAPIFALALLLSASLTGNCVERRSTRVELLKTRVGISSLYIPT